jgi:hypothetical protein
MMRRSSVSGLQRRGRVEMSCPWFSSIANENRWTHQRDAIEL